MKGMKRLNELKDQRYDLNLGMAGNPNPKVVSMSGVLQLFDGEGRIIKKVNALDIESVDTENAVTVLQDRIIDRLVKLAGI